jgi:hypothetical protein
MAIREAANTAFASGDDWFFQWKMEPGGNKSTNSKKVYRPISYSVLNRSNNSPTLPDSQKTIIFLGDIHYV